MPSLPLALPHIQLSRSTACLVHSFQPLKDSAGYTAMCGCVSVCVCVRVWSSCSSAALDESLQKPDLRNRFTAFLFSFLQHQFNTLPTILPCHPAFGSQLSFCFCFLGFFFFCSILPFGSLSLYVAVWHQTPALTWIAPPGSLLCRGASEILRLSFSPGVFSTFSLIHVFSCDHSALITSFFVVFYVLPAFSCRSSFFLVLFCFILSCVGHSYPPLACDAPFLDSLLCPTFLPLSSLIAV